MTRANPLDGLDLDEFDVKPANTKPKAKQEDLDQVAKDNNFPSRQAQATKPVEAPAPKQMKITQPKPANTERPHQHYFRTGRNEQINAKGTAECKAMFERLHKELDVPKGVVLEEALKALEAIKNQAELNERLDREFPNRQRDQ
jgi:hypothetical protein